MILAPGNRLLFWVAALLPFAAAGALIPAAVPLAVVLFAALFAAAAIDAARGWQATRGVTVSLPDTLRLSRGRAGAIPLRVRSVEARELRVGVPLPPSFQSESDAVSLRLPGDGQDFAASWVCTPATRGRFLVERCYFEVPSPLSFWTARGSSPCRLEIRVYPSLLGERKRLAGYFLNRGAFGIHPQRMVGHGRDFEKLREYIPGDNYEDIHWKATAKRGHPITKLYQVERTQEIYVAVDTSRLSARASGSEPALERFIAGSLVLGLAAEQQGDLFGIITFDDRVRQFIRASNGRHHYNVCRDTLYTLSPAMATPDFGELFSFARLKLRRRSLIVILTDLNDPLLSESFLRHVGLVCRHHLVLVAMIQPGDVRPLFSTPDADSTDSLYRNLGGHMIWCKVRELGRALSHSGVAFSAVSDERLSAEIVSQYVGIKARQSL